MTSQNPKTLSETLDQLPTPPRLPIPLPISHLTTVASFENVVNDGGILKPSQCKVFDQELLYFSYGGVFHRHRQEPTQKKPCLPVAILFKPQLLNSMSCFFPYDTGAAKSKKYGSWSDDLSQFRKYKIPNYNESYNLPSKLVYYIYGSNKKYLQGEAISDSQNSLRIASEPLINLLNFLNANLTEDAIDHRQYSIECQTSNLIDLTIIFEHIIWVGLPNELQCIRNFHRLCNMINPFSPPASYFYEVTRVESPYAIARMLQGRVHETIIDPLYIQFWSIMNDAQS